MHNIYVIELSDGTHGSIRFGQVVKYMNDSFAVTVTYDHRTLKTSSPV